MTKQIAFHQCNPNKPHCYDLLLKTLNDARFPYIYKSISYAAKPRAGDGPCYLKSTIDYKKYLVTEMVTISTDRLNTSIKSTNCLPNRRIGTVGTLQKGRSRIPSELFDTQN